MANRPLKVHYVPAEDISNVGLCGQTGKITHVTSGVTCRVCKFRYLAQRAPWAEKFLRELRQSDPSAKTSEPPSPKIAARDAHYRLIAECGLPDDGPTNSRARDILNQAVQMQKDLPL